jgi:hypothetical protein
MDDHAPMGRILERYDGRWAVELTFDPDRGLDTFLSTWTDREAACREGLDEMERRGLATDPP